MAWRYRPHAASSNTKLYSALNYSPMRAINLLFPFNLAEIDVAMNSVDSARQIIQTPPGLEHSYTVIYLL